MCPGLRRGDRKRGVIPARSGTESRSTSLRTTAWVRGRLCPPLQLSARQDGSISTGRPETAWGSDDPGVLPRPKAKPQAECVSVIEPPDPNQGVTRGGPGTGEGVTGSLIQPFTSPAVKQISMPDLACLQPGIKEDPSQSSPWPQSSPCRDWPNNSLRMQSSGIFATMDMHSATGPVVQRFAMVHPIALRAAPSLPFRFMPIRLCKRYVSFIFI